jgi:hypothetical protein
MRALPSKFMRSWQAWLRAKPPFRITREAPAEPLSAKIRYELSHNASYLYSIGQSAISGKNLAYGRIALEELSALERISANLENQMATSVEKAKIQSYIQLVKAVWIEIQSLSDE